MSQNLFARFAVFAPLGRLLHRYRSRPTPIAARTPSKGSAQHGVAARPSAAPDKAFAKVEARRPRLPLRVVRVIDAGQASTLAGRILMSGRMADVCAELDRMVEREASMHSAA